MGFEEAMTRRYAIVYLEPQEGGVPSASVVGVRDTWYESEQFTHFLSLESPCMGKLHIIPYDEETFE